MRLDFVLGCIERTFQAPPISFFQAGIWLYLFTDAIGIDIATARRHQNRPRPSGPPSLLLMLLATNECRAHFTHSDGTLS